MKPLSEDYFGELRPYYFLCYCGFITTSFNLIFVVWLFIHPSAVGAIFVAACVVGLCVAYSLQNRRQLQAQLKNVATLQAAERPRVKSKLDILRAKLRVFTGDNASQLVMVPDPAIVLSTIRSDSHPIVEMSTGFWSTYLRSPALVEAAVAHEAGHIVARDVETFKHLTNLMKVLVLGVFMASILLLVLPAEKSLAMFVGTVIFSGLALALAWSALLVARELQADAYAARVLGTEDTIRALLRSQLERREAQSKRRSLWQRLMTWLIQPNLRWRTTLPALIGHPGSRVEIKLGVATAGFLVAMFMTPSMISGLRVPQAWDYVVYTIVLLTSLFYFWIAYRFFWSRNRATGGGKFFKLVGSLSSYLRFMLPTYVLFTLFFYFLGLYASVHLDASVPDLLAMEFEDPEFAGLFPVFFLFLWGASKISLLSPKERSRRRPSLLRAFIAIVTLRVSCTVVIILLMLVFDLDDNFLRTYNNLLTALAVVFLGAVAHFLTPSNKKIGSD